MGLNTSITKYVEIISIGTELLMGELVDSNSTYLASELPPLGLTLRSATKIGDDSQEITRCIAESLSRSDIVITTGGLGPTSDDVTREAIAAYYDEEMYTSETLLNELKLKFVERAHEMPKTNIRQATLIKSASHIPNPNGTAPGWFAQKNGKTIIALPGPPLELSPMWADHVKPKLAGLVPNIHIITRNIKTFGISEGKLDELFTGLFDSQNPYLGIYSKKDGIHLRIIVKSTTKDHAKSLVTPIENKILDLIGSSVWGFDNDTPHQIAVDELRKHNLTIGIEESFTSGILSNNILSALNGEKVFNGSTVKPHKEEVEENRLHVKENEILVKVSPFDRDRNKQTYGNVSFTIQDKEQSFTSLTCYRDHGSRMKDRAANNALLLLISFIKSNY